MSSPDEREKRQIIDNMIAGKAGTGERFQKDMLDRMKVGEHLLVDAVRDFRDMVRQLVDETDALVGKLTSNTETMVAALRKARFLVTSENAALHEALNPLFVSLQSASKAISSEWLVSVVASVKEVAALAARPDVVRLARALAGDAKKAKAAAPDEKEA